MTGRKPPDVRVPVRLDCGCTFEKHRLRMCEAIVTLTDARAFFEDQTRNALLVGEVDNAYRDHFENRGVPIRFVAAEMDRARRRAKRFGNMGGWSDKLLQGI